MTQQTKLKTQSAEIIDAQPAQPVPAVRQDSGVVLTIIEKMAAMENIDIEKMEKFLEMKERIDDRAREDEDRAAKRDFFADLAMAQRDVPVVVKNRKNTFNNTTFADLAAIEAAAMPVIRDHGFSVSAKSVPGAEQGMQRVLFRVAHRNGWVDEYSDDFPLDNQGTGGKASKTNIQAKGSTVTYARRYMLCAYFNIAIADTDGAPQQPAAPQELTAAQAKELYTLIEETGTDEAQFLKAAKAASVEAISPARFDGLRTRLLQKKNKLAATETATEKKEA